MCLISIFIALFWYDNYGADVHFGHNIKAFVGSFWPEHATIFQTIDNGYPTHFFYIAVLKSRRHFDCY